MTSSLWGDLGSLPVIKTPVAILKEQAQHLTEATRGLLMGEVDNISQGGGFRYDLDIVAPALNGYRYTVLRVIHEVELYPVRVIGLSNETRFECNDEQEFVEALRSILTSEKVKTVMSSLLAQSQA